MGKGNMAADMPSISKILAILLPKTLPMAISELPLALETMFTISSGMDVPNETMVNPITKSDNPNLLPNEVEPFTRKSAPLINITKPIINRTSVNIYYLI